MVGKQSSAEAVKNEPGVPGDNVSCLPVVPFNLICPLLRCAWRSSWPGSPEVAAAWIRRVSNSQVGTWRAGKQAQESSVHVCRRSLVGGCSAVFRTEGGWELRLVVRKYSINVIPLFLQMRQERAKVRSYLSFLTWTHDANSKSKGFNE